MERDASNEISDGGRTTPVIGAANGVYESLDQGDTVTPLAPDLRVNQTGPQILAYGAENNPDVLYVGSGAQIFVRTSAHPTALARSMAYNGGQVVGIALDPHAAATAYVVEATRVFRTTNSGTSWTDITGDLQTLVPGELRSVAYSTSDPAGAVVVGSDTGVFEARGSTFSNWGRLGSGLPVVPVYQLEYSRIDGVLLAATLGRGAWTLTEGGGGAPPNPEGNSQPRTVPAAIPAPLSAAVQPADGNSAFELHPGVIVDPTRSRAYVMSPGSAIDAVDLVSGKEIWNTKVAAKPLGVFGRRLVAQAEGAGDGNTLTVVMIDPATGARMLSSPRAPPPGVRPSISETMGGEFLAIAVAAGADPIVSWRFVQRPTRGVRPGADDSPL